MLAVIWDIPLGAFIFAYLIGSVPVGLILTKIFLKQDIRAVGSGNIGATNVLRTGSKKLAAFTLFLDLLKGLIPVFLVFALLDKSDIEPFGLYEFPPLSLKVPLLVGLFVILGHCFPIWLKFKGGKGVATAFGVLLAATPFAALAAVLGWIASFAITRISSLSALIACAIAPIATYFIYGTAPAVIVAIISALVTARHHANIKRLLKGEESKFTKKKEEPPMNTNEHE